MSNIETRVEELNREITELKFKLAHAEQRINMLTKANDNLLVSNASLNSQAVNQVDLHNKVVVENNELKAQVDALKNGVTHFNKSHGDLNQLLAAYVKTPAQCLQGVKADAVKAFGHDIGLYGSEYDDQEYIEVSRYSLRDHIEQLHEGE